ncbi:MAG: hypothetical protein IPK26_08080 [Planctomycetes bacterium]|nr:hypothetical protein [Planctomycetota bacterium]
MTARPRRRGNWSVQELTRLRQLLPRRGVDDTASRLRRSPDSVRKKALELLRVPIKKTPWTGDEDRQLRDSFGVVDSRLLAVMLGRTPAEVMRRAEQLRAALGGGPWQRAELTRMRQFFGTRTDADLEVCLLRPRAEIVAQARRMCLAKDKRLAHELVVRRQSAPQPMPRWRSDETERLRQLYPDLENHAVATALGRSVTAVANKAHRLGLEKSPALLARLGRDNVAVRYAGVRGGGAAAPVPSGERPESDTAAADA